ncbi:MAG: hypothetical protein MUE53_08735 [Chitinophagales bacterium]|jgi:ABC-type amino acid transport substrate-binding protein|nr:hypothetical protein [Chitinophagales bacterium]
MRIGFILVFLYSFGLNLGAQTKDTIWIGTSVSKDPILADINAKNAKWIAQLDSLTERPIGVRYFTTQNQILDSLSVGFIDIAVNHISLAYDRFDKQVFFSLAYSSNNYVLVGPYTQKKNFFSKIMVPLSLLKIFGVIFFVLGLYGHIIWWVERHRENQIRKPYFPGILDGIYQAFNIVAKLNIDQSRIVNASLVSRFAAIPIWILSIVLISLFVSQINQDILNQDDKSYLISEEEMKQYDVLVLDNALSEDIARDLVDSSRVFTYPNYSDLFSAYAQKPSATMIIRDDILSKAIDLGKINPKDFTIHIPNLKSNNVAIAYRFDFFKENQELCRQVNKAILKNSLD